MLYIHNEYVNIITNQYMTLLCNGGA